MIILKKEDLKMNNKNINIAFATDDNYIKYTGTVICSILDTISKDTLCNFHILSTKDLSIKSKNMLNRIKEYFNCKINYYVLGDVVEKTFSKIKLPNHIKLECYNRLFIPKVLSNLDKVLYLDSDIIVLSDISKIFNVKLNTYLFGAIEDVFPQHRISLGYSDKYTYFNSGVLLLNIKQLNSENYFNKILYSLEHNYEKYPIGTDQDVLNDAFYDRILPLSYRYNMHHEWHGCRKTFIPLDKQDYEQSLADLNIVHFVGPIKPWHENYKKPYAQIFNHYYNFFINGINGNNVQRLEDMQKDIEIVNTETFAKYKGIHKGRDVVLLASGPSASKYKGIKGAIHIGVNKSFLHEVKLDYLFIQDYRTFDGCKDKILNYQGNNVEKFFGIVDNDMLKIPIHVIKSFNAKMYFTDNSKYKPSAFQKNIDKQPLGDFCSVVFSALQFILYTNPSRVYLVGCDCSNEPYFYNDSDSSDLIPDRNINNFKKLKNFIDLYYKDIEIISINPVGLKGVFKDEYAE